MEWLKRFERFCQGQDLRTISDAEVQRFLSDLAVKQGVGASTQNQAFNALLVFPSRQLSIDPRSGIKRRHHVQENAFQKAIAQGAR
jgi:hypothetical protein